jgi:hypothetical protein
MVPNIFIYCTRLNKRQIAEPNTSVFAFLELLMDYHTKTHTMPVYVSSLLTAVSCLSPESQGFYHVSSSSPLFHRSHLERLGKCVHRFLTPGQTVEIVRSILQKLKNDWESFYSASSQHSTEQRSKRRKLEARSDHTTNPEILAVSFCWSSRIASIVLLSLPVEAIPQTVRLDVLKLLEEAQTTFIQFSLYKMVDSIREVDSSDTWATQIVTAAILRFWNTLNGSDIFRHPPDQKTSTALLDVTRDHAILPELLLELVCTILCFPVWIDN